MIRSIMKKTLSAAFLLAAASALPIHASEAWTDKPVRFIVPYSPGGTTDYIARLVAQRLSENLKMSVVVENKAGGSGTIGALQVARAAGDGTTFLVNDTAYTMLPGIFDQLRWDHANDLIPVTSLIDSPVVLVTPQNSPFKNLQELIDFGRANPGKLNFGSGGSGSSAHLQGELFAKQAGIQVQHIPYKGAGEALVGVMSGQVDFLITAAPTAIPGISGKKLRGLAVTAKTRLDELPETPTFVEAALPDYQITNWFGLAAPKGTADAMVQQLYLAVKEILAEEGVQKQLHQIGVSAGGMSPEDFKKFMSDQTELWTGVAHAAGLKGS